MVGFVHLTPLKCLKFRFYSQNLLGIECYIGNTKLMLRELILKGICSL